MHEYDFCGKGERIPHGKLPAQELVVCPSVSSVVTENSSRRRSSVRNIVQSQRWLTFETETVFG